jgi:hypothetical protein
MKYLNILILILLIVIVGDISAQPGLPSSPDQAPIDGGLSLLAAGGAAYAMKKLRDKRKAE